LKTTRRLRLPSAFTPLAISLTAAAAVGAAIAWFPLF
jgi:hypothetical protein